MEYTGKYVNPVQNGGEEWKMDVMEAILTRRSIRKYTKKPIPDAVITQLLKAGMFAPSAGNEQPWHFIVIRDRGILDTIPEYHPYSKMLFEAPVAIVVCGDVTLEKHKGLWVQDCAAAVENILLAAHALGLGAVWLGVHPRDDREYGTRHLLGIPENVIPFAIISLGYPNEKKEQPERFNESRIHYDAW